MCFHTVGSGLYLLRYWLPGQLEFGSLRYRLLVELIPHERQEALLLTSRSRMQIRMVEAR